MNQRGWTKYIAAEMCETINEHWGVSGADFMYKSIPYLIESLCACRKVRANYLLNIGLTSEGAIIPLQKAMLETIGDWLNPNAKPVYEGKPANVDGQHSNFALETEDGKLYLFIHHLKISGHSQVTLENGGEGVQEFTGLNRKAKSVRWLDAGTELPFKQDLKTGSLRFHATNPYGSNYVVRVAEVNFV
jgi:alpha-L-fucosidase